MEELEPGRHRSGAGIEGLRVKTIITIGMTSKRERESVGRGRRMGSSPEWCRRGRGSRRLARATGIEVFPAGVGDEKGETGGDWGSFGSIPWRRTTRT
jgi:hypothetical protein